MLFTKQSIIFVSAIIESLFKTTNSNSAYNIKQIQGMATKDSQPRNELFSELNENQNASVEQKLGMPMNEHLKDNVEPTALSEQSSFGDFVFGRSDKDGPRDYQISFENGFNDKHLQALRKILENFIESAFKIKGELTQVFKKFGVSLEYSKFTIEQENLKDFADVSNFAKQRETQEKVPEFFEKVYETVPKDIANEFLILAAAACNCYLNKEVKFHKMNQILKFAAKSSAQESKNLFNDERIKFLNLKEVSASQVLCKEEVEEAFNMLVESFFGTYFLIVEEYFENPFGQSENAKRERCFHLEDEMDSIDGLSEDSNKYGMPTKKLH